MTRKSFVLMVMGTLVFFLCSVSSADVPGMINYMGKLTKPNGGLLNGTFQMTFSIYPDTLGSPAHWTETQAEVEVKHGVFSVLLGSANPIPASVFDGSIKYLGIQVESDPEMRPLKPMVSVTYAFHSATADTAFNVPPAGVMSIDSVSNPGGDVDLIPEDAISITPNDGANTITVGETHSGRIDNPHQVTAAQTGALVSVDGVDNPGGNVDFVAGANMTITPNPGANNVTFSATGAAGGWTDDGTVVRLETDTDSVGIGTAIPREKLDVSGNIKASGTITSGNTITIDGVNDRITASSGTLSFGNENLVTTGKATFGPGHTNTGINAFVAGDGNTASGNNSVVSGGAGNTALHGYNAVGGGEDNWAGGTWTTVAGGISNSTNGNYAAVGGGQSNTASGAWSTVGGGGSNTTSDGYGTVGGGGSNTASGYSTVGGGWDNTASDLYNTVGGGLSNTASGHNGSTVGGGKYNTASGNASTVGGGASNTASGVTSTVSGGRYNSAAGDYSVIPGGDQDTLTASADYSLAFGAQVYVNSQYRVVLFDSTFSGRVGINRDDHDGGISYPIHVGTNSSNGNGAYLSADGLWTDASSKGFKTDFRPLDGQGILTQISNLPLESWRYKGTQGRHIGPYAEDFARAFGVGTVREDGRQENQYLAPGDVAGVALAGVKQLTQQNQELKQVIELLKKSNALLEARIAELEKTR